MHLSIYLDILMPLKIVIIAFQIENHHSVTAVRRITEFKVACRVQMWKKNHFVTIVKSCYSFIKNDILFMYLFYIYKKSNILSLFEIDTLKFTMYILANLTCPLKYMLDYII